jgi:hypothetical protein
MRLSGFRVALIAGWAVALTACGPNLRNTVFQSYEVHLDGPVPSYVSPELDPFVKTAKYRVTVKYFEDAEGKVPYFQGRKKAPIFANFNPVQTVDLPAGHQRLALTPTGNDASLPRISSSQTNLYVQSEVVGLDLSDKPIARARCPLQELKVLASGGTTTVLCHAFYGFIGRWNEVRSPAVSRVDFAAVALPDGRVVIGGGRINDDDLEQQTDVDTVEIYQPTTPDPLAPAASPGTWVKINHALSARSGLAAVRTTLSGYVFFMGGLTGRTVPSDAWEILDTSTGVMLGAKHLLDPRSQLAAALIDTGAPSDQVFLAGGLTDLSTDILDPKVVAHHGPDSKEYRVSPCVMTLANKQMLTCGGGSIGNPLDTCELATADTSGTSATSGHLVAARGDVQCAVTGKAGAESVYLVGGTLSTTGAEDGLAIERWTGGSVTTVASAPGPLTKHALTQNQSLLYVTGGSVPGTTKPLASGFTLDTTTNTVAALPDMLNPRAGHRLVTLPDGNVMALGGLSDHPFAQVGAEIFVPAE